MPKPHHTLCLPRAMLQGSMLPPSGRMLRAASWMAARLAARSNACTGFAAGSCLHVPHQFEACPGIHEIQAGQVDQAVVIGRRLGAIVAAISPRGRVRAWRRGAIARLLGTSRRSTSARAGR